MSKWYPIKTNFTAGEISPNFTAREDTLPYQNGVQEMRNQTAVAQGATVRRNGTNLLEEVTKADGTPAEGGRVFPFKRGPDENYLGIMGGGRMRLITESDARVSVNIVKNPTFAKGGEDWETVVSDGRWPVWFENGNAVMGTYHFGSNNNFPVSYLRQSCEVLEASDQIRFSTYADYIHERYQLQLFVRISTVGFGLQDVYGTRMLDGRDSNYSKAIDETLDLPSGFTGTVYMEFACRCNLDIRDWGRVRANISHCDLMVYQTVTPSEIPTVTVPYTDDQLSVIQFVENPYTRQIVFVHPDVPPQELVLTGSPPVWSFNEIQFLDKNGSDDNDNPDFGIGYPRAVGTFQGRLLLGGSETHPQRVWGSLTGDWYVFEPESSPTAEDPIEFTMTYVGEIQWIVGQKGLLIGTSNGEYLVSAQAGIIAAGDIQVQDQSRYGSAHVQPANIGDQIIYTTGDASVLRALEYSNDYRGWMSPELTFASSHIAKSGIRKISYSRDPENTIWMVLGDGNVAACNYDRTYSLIGFNLHSFSGRVIDSSIIREGGVDTPVFLIERSIDGASRFYVEAMYNYQNNPVYLDSSMFIQHGSAVTVVTGLSHLEGQPVMVIGDGEYHPESYQVASGQITISPAASNTLVGLSFESRIKFLPMESRQSGGGLGAKKSRPVIGLRLISSSQPFIDGIRPSQNTPTNPVPELVDDFTGNVEISTLGVDGIQSFDVSESTARPMNIIGVYGKNIANNT